MDRLAAVRKAIHGLTLGVSFMGMALLIPMMLLTAADVIGRAVWARPIPGAVEMSSYMLAVFILLGAAYTQQVKGHVRVGMIVSRLPERAGVLLDMATTLLSLFIISILAWQGWVVGMEERTVSDMLRIPQYPFRLLVAGAAFLLGLELVVDLAVDVGKLVRRD
jgi:TRAP-type C4-dicarboxylate transport system permease small subunit